MTDDPSLCGSRIDPARLAVATAAAVMLVLVAPFIGDIRDALRTAFPGGYGQVINLVVGGAVALAILVAVRHISTNRARRYLALGSAVALAAMSSALTATVSSSVNAVERFHFVEYGLVTWLFYRALLPRATGRVANVSLLLVPALAALLVSTVDEWLQWFIPSRVGEWRDILLNGTAIAAGLLFSLGAEPPGRFRATFPVSARRRVMPVAAAFVLVFAAFLHVVHLGETVADPEAGRFLSRYSGDALISLADERRAAWAADGPPVGPGRLSQDDKYLAEAVWHVRARNEAWAEGRIGDAWFENRILETYFDPVLDAETYAAPASRWPAAQRADAEARRGGVDAARFLSRAEPMPLLLWSPQVLWICALASAIILLAIGLVPRSDS